MRCALAAKPGEQRDGEHARHRESDEPAQEGRAGAAFVVLFLATREIRRFRALSPEESLVNAVELAKKVAIGTLTADEGPTWNRPDAPSVIRLEAKQEDGSVKISQGREHHASETV